MNPSASTAFDYVTEKIYNSCREKFIPTKLYDKAKGYIDTVNARIDADTRTAKLVDLGLSAALSIGSKALGASLSEHPYLAIHKTHLQALGTALTASSTSSNALALLQKAARAAGDTADGARRADELVGKMRDLRFEFGREFIFGRSMRQSFADANTGAASSSVLTKYANDFFEGTALLFALQSWRTRVCRVYLDGLSLQAMVRVEWKVASRGGQIVQEKIRNMRSSDSPISRVFGGATESVRQWEIYDRERALIDRKPNAAPPLAMADPALYAQRNWETVVLATRKLAAVCAIAMSTLTPEVMSTKLASAL